MNYKSVDRTTRLVIFLIDLITFFVIVLISFFLLKVFIPSSYSIILAYNRLISFVSFFLYYFIFESISDKTVGKIITKTKIVDSETKSKPSIYKVLIRTLARFIPLEALYILLNEKKLTLHDLISKTTVIYNPTINH
jgi:uncharacterized RDD family membrane protein YckC